MTTDTISLDFELCGKLDLRKVGADVWTKDTDTVPICCAFALDDKKPEVIFFDGVTIGVPEEIAKEDRLMRAIDSGAMICAWNASFEYQVWNNLCVPCFGWPKLPLERFYCTMSAAACAGLPMELGDAGQAIQSPYRKDMAGHAVMLRMAKPRRIDQSGFPVWWHRHDVELDRRRTASANAKDHAKIADMVEALLNYNIMDVLAERELYNNIPRMTVREREIWLTDQRMNLRGLPVDQQFLTQLHAITLQELLRLNTVIADGTNGEVMSASQNVKLLDWLNVRGYPYTSLNREMLTQFVQSPSFDVLPFSAREVLDARAEAAKTSTAKLQAIAHFSQRDSFARNLVQYGGAMRTLRWSGRGPQIQNFPRPIVKYVNEAIDEIKAGMDADGLRALFGRPLDVVSSCLRGVFAAPMGMKLVVADYHAIEAIVIAWLADFNAMLDVFRRGEDIYVFTAKGVGSDSRMLGKVLRLACGYGMGPAKFQDTAEGYNLRLSMLEAYDAVHAFRTANAPIVALWHGCEASAKNAIFNPGRTFTFKHLKFRMALPAGKLAGALLMELPSGRNLVYREARVEAGRIAFHGVDQYTHKWGRIKTYGGKLVENATQAAARDLLADTIVVLDRIWPDTLCTTVHDEIIAMTTEAAAPALLASMKAAMSNAPSWARGMPLSCAGAIVDRYGKL